MTQDSSFTYLSQPHSAPRLLSQTMPSRVPLTLMSDPRVVRGNTHALARKISKNRDTEKLHERVSKVTSLHSSGKSSSSSSLGAGGTPYYQYECRPFAEKDIDMTIYLTEDDKVVVFKKEVETQNDEFVDLPTPLPYIPTKTGIDQSTQVVDTNELFAFDVEVVPLLEVIVRKTLEQALTEVCTEYEIGNLQQEIEEYERIRETERKWVAEHELLLKSDLESKHKIRNEMLMAKQKEKSVKSAIAGLQMMRQLFPEIQSTVMSENIRTGAWVDAQRFALAKDIKDVVNRSIEEVQKHFISEHVLDEILAQVEERFVASSPMSSRQSPYVPRRMVCIFPAATAEIEQEEDQKEENPTQNIASADITIETECSLEDTIDSLYLRIKEKLQSFSSSTDVSQLKQRLLEKINQELQRHYLQNNLTPLPITADCSFRYLPLPNILHIQLK